MADRFNSTWHTPHNNKGKKQEREFLLAAALLERSFKAGRECN
jgi:hypothetical protein